MTIRTVSNSQVSQKVFSHYGEESTRENQMWRRGMAEREARSDSGRESFNLRTGYSHEGLFTGSG